MLVSLCAETIKHVSEGDKMTVVVEGNANIYIITTYGRGPRAGVKNSDFLEEKLGGATTVERLGGSLRL